MSAAKGLFTYCHVNAAAAAGKVHMQSGLSVACFLNKSYFWRIRERRQCQRFVTLSIKSMPWIFYYYYYFSISLSLSLAVCSELSHNMDGCRFCFSFNSLISNGTSFMCISGWRLKTRAISAECRHCRS